MLTVSIPLTGKLKIEFNLFQPVTVGGQAMPLGISYIADLNLKILTKSYVGESYHSLQLT